jgi:glutaminyl-peptide cyclotransferase
MKRLCYIIIATLLFSCTKQNKTEEASTTDTSLLSFETLMVLPHDSDAFTEGLEIHGSKTLESTGQYGNSWITELDLLSGRYEKKVILDEKYFGEGITVLNNKIYYLTYTTRVGFVYDARTYQKVGEFAYDSKIKEGWGLTNNKSNLIMSEGTDKIHFLDTADFKIVKTISVKEGNSSIKQINELEYVNGYIFANVWETNLIVKIDAETGSVIGKLDLSAMVNNVKAVYPQANELNGIAYNPKSKAFLITGKNWPQAFLINIK